MQLLNIQKKSWHLENRKTVAVMNGASTHLLGLAYLVSFSTIVAELKCKIYQWVKLLDVLIVRKRN